MGGHIDYKEFYRKLLQDIGGILKPLGFRKHGVNFRRACENGIAQEVNVQKSQFDPSSFTVNINVGMLQTPITKESWKGCFLQTRRHLGENEEDGLDRQFWYHVAPPEDERVRDGQLCLIEWIMTGGKVQPPLCVPYLTPDEICRDVCHLLTVKAIPYFLSVESLDRYLELLFISHSENPPFHSNMGLEEYVLYAKVYGKRFLPLLEKGIEFTQRILEEGDGREEFLDSFRKRLEIQEELRRTLSEETAPDSESRAEG